MTKEEAKKFGLQLLHGIMERNESYPVYANNVKQAIDALSETSGSSEIPNDLEEAAVEYGKVHTDEVMVSDGYHNDHTKEVFDVTPGEAFIAGAKWQYQKDRGEFAQIKAKTWSEGFDACYEQMMNGAVEGEYGYFSNASKTILPGEKLNLKEGDKVRIIIVKEDEK